MTLTCFFVRCVSDDTNVFFVRYVSDDTNVFSVRCVYDDTNVFGRWEEFSHNGYRFLCLIVCEVYIYRIPLRLLCQ